MLCLEAIWPGVRIILKRSHYLFDTIREIPFPLEELYTTQREGVVNHGPRVVTLYP